MEKEIKTIRIFGKEVKNKKDEKTWVKYTYTPNGEDFYEVHFTKDCKVKPSGTGYLLLDVIAENVGIKKVHGEKGKKYNSIMFISNCSNIREDKEYEDAVKLKKLEEVKNIL